MTKRIFEGVLPAITTPFSPDGSVDHEFLREHAQWMMSQGCSGMVPLGSLGEGNTLEFDEKVAILKTLVEALGDKPVIPGIASLSTQGAVKLAQAAKTIAERQMVVDDRSAISLAQIRAKVRRTQRDREVGLVIVDYLGLVKPPPDAPRNDRRVQVDAIAQGLKNLARDLRVPVLALAQLNRGIESRADKAPGMADLRESGGIEAAADVVILLHRDVVDAPERLEVTIPKNRHGPQARFDLDFQGAYSRAVDPDPYRTGIPA